MTSFVVEGRKVFECDNCKHRFVDTVVGRGWKTINERAKRVGWRVIWNSAAGDYGHLCEACAILDSKEWSKKLKRTGEAQKFYGPRSNLRDR